MNDLKLRQIIREEIKNVWKRSNVDYISSTPDSGILKEEHLMTEAKQPQVYIIDDTLWYSYNPGSGSTTMLKSKRPFWTDKSGDDSFNSTVKDFKKWATQNKPTKKSKKGLMFKIPVYDYAPDTGQSTKLSVWGGDIKPKGYKWMVITPMGEGSKYTIVSLFSKQVEALHWLK